MSLDLMLLVSAITPQEIITNDLENSLQEYKLNPSKQNQASLATSCQMLIFNILTDGDPEKAQRMIEHKDSIQKNIDEMNRMLTVNPN